MELRNTVNHGVITVEAGYSINTGSARWSVNAISLTKPTSRVTFNPLFRGSMSGIFHLGWLVNPVQNRWTEETVMKANKTGLNTFSNFRHYQFSYAYFKIHGTV